MANITYIRIEDKVYGLHDENALTSNSNLNASKVVGTLPANTYTDTTYENKAAVEGGTEVSLVTTGDKYRWNNASGGGLQNLVDGDATGSIRGVGTLPNSLDYSTALGYGTRTNSYYQLVIGTCNTNELTSDNLFVIGNGADNNNRSNALTVDKFGNVDIASGASYKINGTPLIDMFYPVGSYYETSDTSFDPNTAWGGTWVLETAGMVHVSAGTGYSVSGANQSDGVGAKDGGEPTHVLTPDETAMKNHYHTINHGHRDNISFSVNKSVQSADNITGGGHSHTVHTKYQASFASGNKNGFMNNGTGGSTNSMAIIDDNTGTHTHSVPQHSHTLTKSGGVSDLTNGYSGGQDEANGSAHNNMQPYINVNRWHRTA